MSTPTKKRKLNNGSTTSSPSKGLEYFFSKQRQSNVAMTQSAVTESHAANSNGDEAKHEMTDEELARKLQAEWDREAAASTEAEASGDRSESSALRSCALVAPATAGPEATREAPLTVEKQDAKEKTLTLQSAGNSDDTTTSGIPLDESPLTFEPAKYVPDLKRHWASEDGDASYAILTRCFVLASATNSRIKIVDTMTNCLRLLIEGDPSSLLPAVNFPSNDA